MALVMGNSKYSYAVPLPNPQNDAKLMSETLRSAGFSVIEGEDLSKAAMSTLLDRFTEEAFDAEVALVYYAGHGFQVDGQNYLVPVDAQLEKAAHIQTRTIPVQTVLAALPPDPAVSLVILDACRDNPLARTLAAALPASRSTSAGSGLAPVQATGRNGGTGEAGGLLIAYATDPGAVAYDGKSIHSPYTAALVKHLTTPGLEIQSALTRVRAEVATETAGAQRPWHNASLAREVFLGGDAPTPAVTMAALTPSGAPAPSADEADWSVEQRLWDEASKRNTAPHYRLYLEQFPNGRFASMAKLNLEQLEAVGQVAALDPMSALPSAAASQVRTAVAIPDEVKRTMGTAATEALLGLDRDKRADLQLRLKALGQDVGIPDGSLGRRSRIAIAAWQRQSGIVETSYLTPQQYLFLTVQTDPLMPEIRAQNIRRNAVSAPPKGKRQAQVRQAQVSKRQQVRRTKRDTVVVRRRAGGSPAGAAFMGGLIGGAIGGFIGSR